MNAPLCLVGEVVVDVMPPARDGSARRVRLGGVVHAARAAWALRIPYDLRFIAPTYLESAIVDYANRHGAASCESVGVVDGAPNVMLIGEPTEAGDQAYELLLRKDHSVQLSTEPSHVPAERDALFIVSDYPVRDLSERLGVDHRRIHVDLGNYSGEIADLISGCATTFVSTSSPFFSTVCHGRVDELVSKLTTFTGSIVFKENRGGTRFFAGGDCLRSGAYVRPVVHSVGVGDCFDVAFVAKRDTAGPQAALAYAALVAAEYAGTTYPDDFKSAVDRGMLLSAEEIVALPSVQLDWEKRQTIDIYVAGPDFSYVNRSEIESAVAALEYHNFRTRRPIAENGQLTQQSTPAERRRTYLADLALLRECKMMVAVLPFDDPGTLVEIGIASEMGMPVIVYDPCRRAHNPMVTETPRVLSHRLDDVISGVFSEAAKLLSNV